MLKKAWVPKRVLIVEDDPVIQAVISDVCTRIDSKVKIDCVATAEEADYLLSCEDIYDLVIADINLAGPASGVDLWKKYTAKFPDLGFIFTAYNWPGVEEVPFLAKPFSTHECQKLISKFIAPCG